MSKARCAEVVASNKCPLTTVTGCKRPGNRIRVLQHVAFENNINTDWTASQKADDSIKNFLDLPREIRDAIYDFVLPIGQHLHLGSVYLDPKTKTSHSHARDRGANDSEGLALLRSSKQLHHEVAARFYSANTFSVECASSGHVTSDAMLSTFGFAGLLPLHPAYARFLLSISLRIVHAASPAYTSRYPYAHYIAEEPEVLVIANPARPRQDSEAAPSTIPQSTAGQIDNFNSAVQADIDAKLSCRCLRLIHLGAGTYTLRRPPGPERERCKKATWNGVKDEVAYHA